MTLEQLAAKLERTPEHLWEVLAAQAFIYSVAWCVGLIFWALILKVAAERLWSLREASETYNCGYIPFLGWGCWYVLFLVFTLTLVGQGELIVAGFLTPEYWAFHQILESKE
jgi:hypothetical protein